MGSITNTADSWGTTRFFGNTYVEIKNPTNSTATIYIDGTSAKVSPGKYYCKTIYLEGENSKSIYVEFTNGGNLPNNKKRTISRYPTVKKGNNYDIR